MKIVSRKQQAFFGRISKMKSNPGKGPSPQKARMMLQENAGMMRGLPMRAPSRVAKRTNSRSGGR